jgi:succinoglycan biosynthesis protein ExoA
MGGSDVSFFSPSLPGQQMELVLDEVESGWAATLEPEADAPRLKPTQLPTVSILIPVRNGASHIGRCLGAVLRQDYPAGLTQIIVADGESTDGTLGIIKERIRGVAHAQLLRNARQIVPTAMNLMTPMATGDVIIRIDGHCEVPPDYVSRCVEHLTEDGVDGVGGSVTTIGHTPLSGTIALAMSSRFGVGDSAFRTQSGRSLLADTVPFPAYTRSIVALAGPYDEELVRDQDDEYNYRIREVGGRLLLAGDINTRYYGRTSLSRLWRQYFEYGFYKVRVLQKHPRQMRPRQLVPPLFALALLLSLCITGLFPWGWAALAAVAGSYALANITASAAMASKKSWRHMTILPVVYAILHVSYGIGFLVGLMRFWNRWGDRVGEVPGPAPSRLVGSGVLGGETYRDR